MTLFVELGLMIILATIGALVAKFIRQPLIPAYMIVGSILGSLGLVQDRGTVAVMSEIGIAFLLFIIGLNLDFKKFKSVGLVGLFGGFIQFIILFIAGFTIGGLLGFLTLESIYVGLILSLSSTLVVVKLLADKKELETLHARIAIAFLILQDIIAIIAIAFFESINDFSPAILSSLLIKGLGIILLAIFFARFVLARFFQWISRSNELLFLSAIAWCFLLSILYQMIGFSIAIGAFVAGLSLGNIEYRNEIVARVKSLRDFFITLFFVSLGFNVGFADFPTYIIPILVFTLFTITIKPLVTLMIIGMFGFTKRVSFATASFLPQISEFSLIIMAAGMSLKHVEYSLFYIASMSAMITMTISSYTVKYDAVFYGLFEKYLTIFERKKSKKLERVQEKKKYDVVLLGYDRVGFTVLTTLMQLKKKILIVDFNPDVIKYLSRRGIDHIYGDVGDPFIFDKIPFKNVKYVISTIGNKDINRGILKRIKAENKGVFVFLSANYIEDALELYKKGADYVILPHLLGGEYISLLLKEYDKKMDTLTLEREGHVQDLKKKFLLKTKHIPSPFGR